MSEQQPQLSRNVEGEFRGIGNETSASPAATLPCNAFLILLAFGRHHNAFLLSFVTSSHTLNRKVCVFRSKGESGKQEETINRLRTCEPEKQSPQQSAVVADLVSSLFDPLLLLLSRSLSSVLDLNKHTFTFTQTIDPQWRKRGGKRA